ncbi:ClbS/DfsB family four-helix bundle protein [Nereida sp. MMG025]|uniref:ClbS/DfsB family four-helix bundle protein n=1 Tax=Nereida sp. MMG025 TaxID=2909981 RepID=UPI001F33F93D|nr:ClbS/DfsB family four-helix bundle protein [Nereida sp. MMG025]MCF6443519.1 ClbS/DfsB family four-helix bundle protein [Nereida sp. MMG025]
MPATSKRALQEITVKEYQKLQSLIDAISSTEAQKKDSDDISIKDIIAHRARWITLFMGWYADGQAGKDAAFPAAGYKWNALPRYNADLRAKQATVDWPQAKQMFATAHETPLLFITKLPESALYGGPMKGAKNTWTTGRWAEAAGPSHYRSAAKYIRARRRALA